MRGECEPILRIAVPAPLRGALEYLPPRDVDPLRLSPGLRLRVPLKRGTSVGLLVEIAEVARIAPEKLRRAHEVLDSAPLLSASDLALMCWASSYYLHPIGEVIAACLPVALRRGRAALLPAVEHWRLTAAGRATGPEALRAAPRQEALLRLLASAPDGLSVGALDAACEAWRRPMRSLLDKGHVEVIRVQAPPPQAAGDAQPRLRPTSAQAQAIAEVCASFGRFQPFLLDGVTGSGKTEVYLRVIEAALALGRQALVLIPEIALTRQTVGRFAAHLGCPIVVLHSGLNDRERLVAWLAARNGDAGVVIGTRSAVWTPLPRPGVVIVDEEHDLSYKQQEGFRYCARDVAVFRARQHAIPVVLGSATPSLETAWNARRQRYRRVRLPERVAVARAPVTEVVALRGEKLQAGMSGRLLRAIGASLERGEQSLLFLNRRGYAPAVLCHGCGFVLPCSRCDTRLVLHKREGLLRCHHCAAERPMPTVCERCGKRELIAVGVGTEQLVERLERHFKGARILRFDRDSARRRGALEAMLEAIRSGSVNIIVGTQMLSKGHDFPNVTLVGIIDADSGMYSADFRSMERMAQLLTQVAGRAGRGHRPGRVVIQTHAPDHPLLEVLLRQGYSRFCEAALEERREAQLPPFSVHALLRAEARNPRATTEFLTGAAALARRLAAPGVAVLGPVAAPMERRAGYHRGHLLLQALQRRRLFALLGPWIESLDQGRRSRAVRWSVDVDPQELL
jgi:primosomal protein N' (replication factor Y)